MTSVGNPIIHNYRMFVETKRCRFAKTFEKSQHDYSDNKYNIFRRTCVFISFFSLFFADPYVKVWLHVGDKKVEKRKSMVFKCNLNPVFDEKFEYTLPVEQLREAALEVMVMDFDNIGRNELIGKITISCERILFLNYTFYELI